ncbi:hypothetical protein PR202_ga00561 [Eleusine coracana subsp. coracana]|uniref:Pre-mRNA-processing protein 40C n=1 Tax=Eleusine coracana subsp. coracana TaxID=191504 RepID=A0AAV5BFU7_ELECO|nr:hypothetical protein PR202_ga00561 [Eleusine coracana subsp. coracana]
MAPPMPASTLQPPAPGQYFGNRPSFSYNVAPHVNARLPTGQQFQLDTGTNHAGQVPRFIPPDANNQSVAPRPEAFGAIEPSVPGQPSAVFSNAPSLLGRPIVQSASPLPQTTQLVATPGVIPQNSQPQFYPSYSSTPGGIPPQPLWGHPHPQQPTGFHQASFQSYSAGPAGLVRPMFGTSTVTTSLPAGVTAVGDRKDQALTNPGSEQPIHPSAEPPSTGKLLFPGNGSQVNDKRNSGAQDSDAWSAHKTETGAVYYYNALTGESTYHRPPGYKGEPDKVATQPVPVSWDKLVGTDWSIVTTSDGKKYYYDNKQKVSSWQLPPEVAEILKHAESGSVKESSTSLQDAATVENKGVMSIDTSTPAAQTGGRDSLPLRQTVAPASPSALDLIKKKLQDAGASSAPSPLATPSAASELNGSKPADAAPKGQQASSNGEKSKDNNGDGNMSDSSSDSDDEEHGPSKEDCIRQFKEMLKERGVAPFSKWEKELPKIVFDPRFKVKENFRNDSRYKAVTHEERESIFNEYIAELKSAEQEAEQAAKAKVDEQAKLRERERETRKRKEREEQEMERVKLKIRRKEAVSSYQALLVEMIKDPKASWTESKPKLEKDPQGRAVNPDLGKGDAEKLFRDHVKDLYERRVRDFRALLSEVITPEAAMRATDEGKTAVNSWTEAKGLLRSDPRYNKLASKDRELIWRRYADDLTRKLKQSDTKEKSDTDVRQRRSSDPPRRR